MRHLPIFFSVLPWLLAAPSASPAVVIGQVEVTPDPKESAADLNLSDVAVWLEPAAGAHALPPAAPRHVRLLQKDKMFHPHVLAVRVGTIVDFPNADPIFHNAFSNYDGQSFDVGLYPPGTTRSVHFNRPGIVRVFCNIHSSMAAVIVVLESPYFTTSERSGQFRIPSVPPGTYELHVFDERASRGPEEATPVVVSANEEVTVLAPLRLSETAYIRVPHLNKYGLPYEPDSDSGSYQKILR